MNNRIKLEKAGYSPYAKVEKLHYHSENSSNRVVESTIVGSLTRRLVIWYTLNSVIMHKN
jgi:hypothetical protein